VDIYGIFLRTRLRDIINSRRDLKLVLERKAKIGGENESILRPDVPFSLENDLINMNTSRKLIL